MGNYLLNQENWPQLGLMIYCHPLKEESMTMIGCLLPLGPLHYHHQEVNPNQLQGLKKVVWVDQCQTIMAQGFRSHNQRTTITLTQDHQEALQ